MIINGPPGMTATLGRRHQPPACYAPHRGRSAALCNWAESTAPPDGVAIGGLFAGESMFHRVRDASKVALVGLVGLLRDEHAGDRLLDVQWVTPHLASLGAVEVPRATYLRMLARALAVPTPAPWQGEARRTRPRENR
jgi:leucyl/phenylalanyl-tRNA--protein transferase